MKKTDQQEILEAIQGAEARSDRKILEAIQGAERRLGQRIDGVETSLGQRIDELHEATDAFSSETDKRFTRIESLMVTKDYLDVKLADQRSDIVNQVKRQMPEWMKTGS